MSVTKTLRENYPLVLLATAVFALTASGLVPPTPPENGPPSDDWGNNIIWRWDGTMTDILSTDEWPVGYLHNEGRMTVMEHAGRHCVRFHEGTGSPSGGFDSVAITLVIPKQYADEWHGQFHVYVPEYFRMNGGWWNICSPKQEYGGGEYFSDPLRFGDNLRSILVGPEPEEHYYKSDYYMPKGFWVRIRFHVDVGNGDGFYQVWFDDRLVHDISGLDNDHGVAGEHGFRCRLCCTYASGSVSRPFDVYFSGMVLGGGAPS